MTDLYHQYPAIYVTDAVLFTLMMLSTLYVFVFALFSLRGTAGKFPRARKEHRMVILFPAYNEDKVIEASVSSVLGQHYPRDMYDVVVISDGMGEDTNQRLEALGARVLRPVFDESSKARALNYAMHTLRDEKYDVAVILDADNTVENDFLREINNAYNAGIKAIQAHRKAKNLNTDTAVLDAVSEEINNSIFRKGHVSMGLSSALIGSGMAFDYKWFAGNVGHLSSAGEDKELEVLLLKQGIYIEYLDRVPVYDEKTQNDGAFYRQRRRWLAAQFGTLGRALRDLPGALFSGNFDYCDKLVQWMMPPRIISVFIISLCGAALCLIDWIYSVRWWGMLLLLLFSLAIAIPDHLVDSRFYRAMRKVPLLGLMMVANMFRLRGVNKKFIHTDHSH